MDQALKDVIESVRTLFKEKRDDYLLGAIIPLPERNGVEYLVTHRDTLISICVKLEEE